jgi:adenosylcobinamide-GDP ribazoletransferase
MRHLRIALTLLTILPVGYAESDEPGRAFAFFPLVGLMIGAVLALLANLLRQWIPADLAAFGVVVVWVIITGGLHLDGFGDACDGLLATVEPERRLEIMKDPRAGSWAVVGLVLLLLGKWLMVRQVTVVDLIVPAVMGRWTIVLAAYRFPYARPTGLGAYFRRGLGQQQVIIATLTTVLIVGLWSLLGDRRGIVLLLVGWLLVMSVGHWAARRLNGGLTGDVYGALCELTELVTLLGLSLL